jgi:hypothetical protein
MISIGLCGASVNKFHLGGVRFGLKNSVEEIVLNFGAGKWVSQPVGGRPNKLLRTTTLTGPSGNVFKFRCARHRVLSSAGLRWTHSVRWRSFSAWAASRATGPPSHCTHTKRTEPDYFSLRTMRRCHRRLRLIIRRTSCRIGTLRIVRRRARDLPPKYIWRRRRRRRRRSRRRSRRRREWRGRRSTE